MASGRELLEDIDGKRQDGDENRNLPVVPASPEAYYRKDIMEEVRTETIRVI